MTNYQPRWLAFSRFMGVGPESDSLKASDYMAWIDLNARRYREVVGVAAGYPIGADPGFTTFLDDVAEEAEQARAGEAVQ